MVSLKKRRRRVGGKSISNWKLRNRARESRVKNSRCIKIYLNSIFILHKHLYPVIGLENISTSTDSCALEKLIVYTRDSISLPYFWPIIGSNHSWVELDLKRSTPCPNLGNVAITIFQKAFEVFQFSQHCQPRQSSNLQFQEMIGFALW